MLKKLAVYMFLPLMHLAAFSQEKADTTGAVLKFEELTHDFGKIKRGETKKHDFVFTNAGKEPAVLLSVSKTCTCTKVKWSKKPVKSGEQGTITVSYNARDKGAFYQRIEVADSSPGGRTTLSIKGSVE